MPRPQSRSTTLPEDAPTSSSDDIMISHAILSNHTTPYSFLPKLLHTHFFPNQSKEKREYYFDGLGDYCWGFLLINKNMNNTKSSRLSLKTTKPNVFRVFLKHRTNQRENATPLPTPYHQKDQSAQEGSNLGGKSESISKMKDFVRARLKTDMSNSSQIGSRGKERTFEKDPPMKKSAIDLLKNTHQRLNASSISQFKAQSTISQPKLEANKTTRSSLIALQDRAQALLMQKLHHCSTHKGHRSSELEGQVRELIKDIREVQINPQGGSASAVSLINSKIRLFEKLIAQTMAEGDIIRKHLQSRLATKMKARRLKTQPTGQSKQICYRDTEQCREVVVNTSMNQESFRSPAPPAYSIQRHRPEYFNPDRHRQPLPRSSYNRDFLIYDQVAQTGIIPKSNMIMARSSSANIFRSSYRDSFVPKTTTRVNIRELDACKDKIKNLPVDYSKRNRAASGMLHYDICKERSQPRRYEQTNRKGVSGRYLLSESRRQYGQEFLFGEQSFIKHQNLDKMHYQYKKMLHA